MVGITGTNGKSTTTALVHHILKTAGVPTTMGGNIGLPILAQDPLPEGGVYVLELSSYQIDLTQSLDCDVAVLLNITPDHLDRYESFEAYAASKARLFEMQSLASIRPSFMTATRLTLHISRCRRVDRTPRSTRGSTAADGGTELSAATGPRCKVRTISECCCGASPSASALGLTRRRSIEGLRTYPGLPHRMERIREKDGVALRQRQQGDQPDRHRAGARRVRSASAGSAAGRPRPTISTSARRISGTSARPTRSARRPNCSRGCLSPHMPVKNCGKLDDAVRRPLRMQQAGDTVLLSPACASFDQFRDFEDRGDQFRRLGGGL